MCRGAEGASILLPGAAALAYDRHRPPARGRKAKGNGLGPAAGATRGLYRHLVADRARAALARAARDPRPAGGALGARRAGAARWRAGADAGRSAAWLVLALLGRTTPASAGVALLAAGLSIGSWLDDLRSLPAWLRLAAHLVAAAIGLSFLPGADAVFQGLLPPLFDRMATALLWVWFVNLFNFMDG